MALVLTMPDTDLDSSSPPFDPSNGEGGTAQAAADLLELGEAKVEQAPVGEGMGTLEALTHDDVQTSATESNGQPEKKKRKPRTPKKATEDQPADAQASESTPATDVPPVDSPRQVPSPVEPQSVSKQVAEAFQSRVTRKFKIAEVTAEYVETSLNINNLEDGIEQAKSRLKHLREVQSALALELRGLRNDEQWQPDLPLEVQSSPPAAAVEVLEGSASQATTALPAEPDTNKTVAAPSSPPLSSTVAANGDDSWKLSPIEKLGLPPKLAEKLFESDGIATIGHLEELRSNISLGHAKWPKGIGAAKITLIEDAVVNWLTKNRDAAAFAQVQSPEVKQPAGKSEVSKSEITPQAKDARPSRRPAADSNGKSDKRSDHKSDDPPEQSDAEWTAEITARAKAINDGSANCLDRKNPNGDGAWASGYEAHGRVVDGEDCKVTDCPYIPGIERDDWLRGFMAAEKVEQYEPSPAAAQEAEDQEAELVSLDDL